MFQAQPASTGLKTVWSEISGQLYLAPCHLSPIFDLVLGAFCKELGKSVLAEGGLSTLWEGVL